MMKIALFLNVRHGIFKQGCERELVRGRSFLPLTGGVVMCYFRNVNFLVSWNSGVRRV